MVTRIDSIGRWPHWDPMLPIGASGPTGWRRKPVGVVSDAWGGFVGVGEGCGQAGEQQIEAAVEFGGAVVGG